MTRLVLAAVAVVALGAPASARADAVYFRGGCGYHDTTTNNPTGTGALGGTDVWTGVIDLVIVPTDAAGVPVGGPVTAWCELTINGNSQGSVLGPVSGEGAVAAAAPWQFRAGPFDIVKVCEHVTTPAGSVVRCLEVDYIPLPPQSVRDLIDPVLAELEPAFAVEREAVAQADTTACAVLGGDTTYDSYLLWHCALREESR